jgi:hypothetical protein
MQRAPGRDVEGVGIPVDVRRNDFVGFFAYTVRGMVLCMLPSGR